MQSAINRGTILIRRKAAFSLVSSFERHSRLAVKFGEDKEEFSKIFSRFLADFRAGELFAYGRPSFSSIFPVSFYFFISTDEPLTLFSRGYTRDHIFSPPPNSFSLPLSLSHRAYTPLVQSKTRVCMHYDERERTRVRRAGRTGREHCVGGEKKEKEKNLFLRPQRRRLVSSWPYLLLVLSRRTSDRESKREGRKKVGIKTRSTGVNACEFYARRIIPRRTAGPFDIRHESAVARAKNLESHQTRINQYVETYNSNFGGDLRLSKLNLMAKIKKNTKKKKKKKNEARDPNNWILGITNYICRCVVEFAEVNAMNKRNTANACIMHRKQDVEP